LKKNAMQIAKSQSPQTIGELRAYLDSLEESWSGMDRKYLGEFDEQPLYTLQDNVGYSRSKALYSAEFGLTFMAIDE